MNYAEGLKYLEELGKFGIVLGMERIDALLRIMGNPQEKIKTVHVAGTNGKGSVTSMIADILLESGLRVGKFTSPHFVKYNERITIDDEDISDEDFASYLTEVRDACRRVLEQGLEQPTQFEILTALAFRYFADRQVDYAVIEVGLGGLWDSTNVIVPEVSVITNIALDHTDRLGDTIEKIAMQKAGIIKDGVAVITGAEGDALGPIKAMCFFKRSPLYIYGEAFSGQEVESSITGQTFTLSCGGYHSNYSIRLPGKHQIVNTSVAVVAAKCLSKKDARITEEALHAGVARTVWPGRLELLGTEPAVILDGAHNPNGATALREALDKYYPGSRVHFVFGMMGDKATGEVMEILFRPRDRVYAVRADASKRAAEAEDLAGRARSKGFTAEAYGSLALAYDTAKKNALAAVSSDIVCVCGSLYMIGEFKKCLQR